MRITASVPQWGNAPELRPWAFWHDGANQDPAEYSGALYLGRLFPGLVWLIISCKIVSRTWEKSTCEHAIIYHLNASILLSQASARIMTTIKWWPVTAASGDVPLYLPCLCNYSRRALGLAHNTDRRFGQSSKWRDYNIIVKNNYPHSQKM